ERHLGNEPVVACPPSRVYRFKKLVRRNKLAFSAGATVVAVLVIGVVVSMWQAVAATHAKHEAEQERRRAQTEAARADRNASQEAAQRRQAEDAALEVRKTLAASDFLQATRLIAEDKSPDALAYLQRCLSLDPSNLAALTRLTSLLAYRKWMMPLFSLKGSNAVNSALFSPEGHQTLSTSPQ